MANTISTSFIEQFDNDVKLAYQRMGSKLAFTVRRQNGVQNKFTFQKLGKGNAVQKARNADIPLSNPTHSTVNVTTLDYYSRNLIDNLDENRINHDEKMAMVKTQSGALGRTTDSLIFSAMSATTTTLSETTNGFTTAFAMNIIQKFGENDVPDDGNRYCVLDYANWVKLLQLQEFTSSDYVDGHPLSGAGVRVLEWSGIKFFPHSALTVSTGNATCYAWHSTSTGLAIGQEASTTIERVPEKDATQILSKMQMNAVLIDGEGCIKLTLKP